MEKNKHREPTLYIVGNEERKDEIKHILENELGGNRIEPYTYRFDNTAYFVDVFGRVNKCCLDNVIFKNAIEKGWMKELKLPDRPKFKPFDKVVARSSKNSIWFADFYSRYLEYGHQLIGFDTIVKYCLPYNEQTAKLIGTSDEWKVGANEL